MPGEDCPRLRGVRRAAAQSGKTEATVRSFLNTDVPSAEEISAARYPTGWTEVPYDRRTTTGLALEGPDQRLLGYALIESDDKYISDLVVAPEAKPTDSLLLMSGLFALLGELGGQWRAHARHSTSYRLIKLLGYHQRIEILADELSNEPMGDEPMHAVSFRITERQDEPFERSVSGIRSL